MSVVSRDMIVTNMHQIHFEGICDSHLVESPNPRTELRQTQQEVQDLQHEFQSAARRSSNETRQLGGAPQIYGGFGVPVLQGGG